MAINTFINVTADKSVATRPSSTAAVHTAVGGTTTANDFSIAYDTAVVTTLTIYDSLVAAARQRAVGGGLK